MVYGTEKPLSKRGRVLATIAAWLFAGAPVFVAMWFWNVWIFLALFALAVWATWDYLKKGDMFSQVDHAISHHVRTGEDANSRFGKDR